MKGVVAFVGEDLADHNRCRWLVEDMHPSRVPGGWEVGHLGRTVPCCQFLDACHFSRLPALVEGSLWEAEHQVQQPFEAELVREENSKLVVGSGS